jgi:hypothetical protein
VLAHRIQLAAGGPPVRHRVLARVGVSCAPVLPLLPNGVVAPRAQLLPAAPRPWARGSHRTKVLDTRQGPARVRTPPSPNAQRHRVPDLSRRQRGGGVGGW